jgi:hypothetical protein
MDYDMAIAELKTRRDAASIAIVKLDEKVAQHDDIIGVLVDSLATKEDIAGLRSDLRERLDRDDLIDEKLAHYQDRLKQVESVDKEERAAAEHRHQRRMNWAVVVLFVVEIAQGIALYLKAGRHG